MILVLHSKPSRLFQARFRAYHSLTKPIINHTALFTGSGEWIKSNRHDFRSLFFRTPHGWDKGDTEKA